VRGTMRGEVFVEGRNVFNRRNIRAVNSVVATDPLGNPLVDIPGAFPLTNAFDARQMQIGFKFIF
jgi:hypothetical protein